MWWLSSIKAILIIPHSLKIHIYLGDNISASVLVNICTCKYLYMYTNVCACEMNSQPSIDLGDAAAFKHDVWTNRLEFAKGMNLHGFSCELRKYLQLWLTVAFPLRALKVGFFPLTFSYVTRSISASKLRIDSSKLSARVLQKVTPFLSKTCLSQEMLIIVCPKFFSGMTNTHVMTKHLQHWQ